MRTEKDQRIGKRVGDPLRQGQGGLSGYKQIQRRKEKPPEKPEAQMPQKPVPDLIGEYEGELLHAE